MRTLSKVLAVSAGALALAAATAGHAATVTIWAGIDGGSVNFLTSGTNTADFTGTLGGFSVNHLSGNVAASPISATQALDTTCDESCTGGSLDIFVSVQGLTAPLGDINWLSTFQTQPLGAGWTLTERTWLSTANNPMTGVLLGNAAMSSNPLPQESHNFAQVDTGAGPYAINTEYIVTATGPGSANSTIDVFNEGIPEPTTWGLMIMGFGGVGALLRNRRRQVTFA